ncbi:MAG TPA: hypothetical protein VFI02_08100, partial [Armatimonadota bacterium]|nr:hypothetical protein [Armatimonadota bacterium]
TEPDACHAAYLALQYATDSAGPWTTVCTSHLGVAGTADDPTGTDRADCTVDVSSYTYKRTAVLNFLGAVCGAQDAQAK